ncbi:MULTISPECIES: acyltransferase [unclassified Microbacterium]|uniref:acyltransferase family protein n=1 Tax=unclassified Microbacterium TaxID=2609290 RepID=UPI00214C9575|nr:MULTISPECIES: acyltransferase [unclassified Microbacterium]MCR2808911.1 acyltransferase [Microbacterium sp. zg.B185]WIM18670.1 acyltransferase [Microbacterium sp. zg-B185]
MAATTSTEDTVPSARHLNPRVRAGLDVARAAAAVYVVLHHTTAGPLAVLFSFGQEAVLVFFLLSGFVIFANEHERVMRPGGYYLRRLRRIYPPMLFAMLVSTALWATGLIEAEFTWQSLVGTLVSVQDIAFLKPGVISDPYLGNDPLWSLSYEVFFYLIFPLVMILWRRSRSATRLLVPVVAVVAYGTFLVWPNHLSLVLAYFVVWWVGGMAAHLYLDGRLTIKDAAPELVGIGSLVVTTGVGVVAYGFAGLGYFPFLILRHCVVVFALFLLLLTPVRHGLAALSYRVARPAAAIAGVSYGLYVVHFPLMVQTGAMATWWYVPALVITVGVAWIADKWVPSLMPRAPRD